MKDLNVLAIDASNKSFQLHMNDERGRLIFKREVKRGHLLEVVAKLPRCMVVLESCGGTHHWAREFRKFGHEVKLIAPQHVIPFRKSNKNDTNDAQAIAEAAVRPSMNFVPVKELWHQDIQCLHRIRHRLIKNQTSLVNETRGILGEYGIIVGEGINRVRAILPEIVQDKVAGLTFMMRRALGKMHEELLSVTEAIEEIDLELENIAKTNETCRRLDEIEGIGPVTATALIATCGDPSIYKNGRQFAASLGLVPGHTQTGGKSKSATMLGITKRGDSYIRAMLVQGGMSLVCATEKAAKAEQKKGVVERMKDNPDGNLGGAPFQDKVLPYRARRKSKSEQDKFHKSAARRGWLKRIIDERGTQKAAVAMANKNARIAWVLLRKNISYNPEKCFGKVA